MKKDKFIARDLGTGGIKASLFSADGVSLCGFFRQYGTYFPKDKHIEQRPSDWWNAVCHATRQLLEDSCTQPCEIACIALSGHSLVAVPLGAGGNVLAEQVPIWCDTRAGQEAAEFFDRISYEDWYSVTGNGDPPETYTPFKLMWMKRHQPEIYEKAHIVLRSKDFINYTLTGVLRTDPSYASGSGTFSLLKWQYEKRFMEAAGECGLLPGTRDVLMKDMGDSPDIYLARLGDRMETEKL